MCWEWLWAGRAFTSPVGSDAAVSPISFTAHHFTILEYVSKHPACLQLVQPKFVQAVKDIYVKYQPPDCFNMSIEYQLLKKKKKKK